MVFPRLQHNPLLPPSCCMPSACGNAAAMRSMPRHARIAPGGIVCHALNRGNGRTELFHKTEDYSAFERIMIAAAD